MPINNSLKETAKAMVEKGKGILAADESAGTCEKRFKNVDIEYTEENRRLYREMLLTAAGIEKYISGVIFFDETLRQSTSDGIPFPEILNQKGILPGIKVDKKTKELPFFPGEKHTEGLDGLRERLAEYAKLGAKFTKWRAVITIDTENKLPTDTCIETNAKELALYAALSQEAGLVPIVEPEVLINGNHTIEQSEEVNTKTLKIVFQELKKHNVNLEGVILKPSMVISGKECQKQASKEEIAEKTIKTLKNSIPDEVQGVAFLSGGQAELQATENLNEMNKGEGTPWNLTFSYGRALQESALKCWAQDPNNNREDAQKILLHRAKMNSLATKGEYSPDLEKKN